MTEENDLEVETEDTEDKVEIEGNDDDTESEDVDDCQVDWWGGGDINWW